MNKIVEKISDVLSQSVADAIFDKTKITDEAVIDDAIKQVVSALGKIESGLKAYEIASPLHDVLGNYNREKAIPILSDILDSYKGFINLLSPATGMKVVDQPDGYDLKTDETLRYEIKYTIMIIYFAAIVEEAAKVVVTKVAKHAFCYIDKHLIGGENNAHKH